MARIARLIGMVCFWILVWPIIAILCLIVAAVCFAFCVALTIITLPLSLVLAIEELIPEGPSLSPSKEYKKLTKRAYKMLRKHKYIAFVLDDHFLQHIVASLDMPVMLVPRQFPLNDKKFLGKVFVLSLSNNVVSVELLGSCNIVDIEHGRVESLDARIDLNDPSSLENLRAILHCSA